MPLRTRASPLALLLALAASGCFDAPSGAPRLCDPTGLLSGSDREALEARRDLLAAELGIDLAIVLAGGSPVGHSAAGWLEGLGARRDGAAALLAFDPAAGRMRVEVGYGLEGAFPDALLGHWLDAQLGPLLARGDVYEGLLLTQRMLSDRARRTSLEARPAHAFRYASGGAGASTSLRAPPHSEAPKRSPARGSAPHPTVHDAYAAYLAWLADGEPEARPALFDDASRDFLDAWPLTAGYLEHVLWLEARHAVSTIVAGRRALLFATDDPFLAPHFFVHDGHGWRMDLVTEVREVVSLAGGTYAWGFRSGARPALAPFADELVDVGGILRLRAGDNRTRTPPGPKASGRGGACPAAT